MTDIIYALRLSEFISESYLLQRNLIMKNVIAANVGRYKYIKTRINKIPKNHFKKSNKYLLSFSVQEHFILPSLFRISILIICCKNTYWIFILFFMGKIFTHKNIFLS